MEILKISLDLGDGQVEDIIIHDDDSPTDLAHNFCLRHNLNHEMFEILQNQFRAKKDSVKQTYYNRVLSQNHSKINNNQGSSYNFYQQINTNRNQSTTQRNHSTDQQQDSQISPLKEEYLENNMDDEEGDVLSDDQDNLAPHGNNSKNINKSNSNNRSVTPTKSQSTISNNRNIKTQRQGNQSQNQDSNYNAGIRLYLKGVKKQEELTRQAQEAKVLQEVKEYEGLTFQPQLHTKKSKQFVRNGKPEDFLINYGRFIQEKHAKLRKEYQYQQENFDFKPKINNKSKRIDQEKSMYAEENVETSSFGGNMNDISINQKDRFSELYEDGLKKKLRQLIAKRRISSGGNDSKDNIGSPERQDLNQQHKRDTSQTVFDRMYDQAQNKKQKLSMIQHIHQQNIDKQTGKPLFRPQTGRSPISRPADNGQNIGDHLYQQYHKQQEKKQKQQELHMIQIKDMHKKSQTNNKVSSQIVEQKQRTKLGEIFDVFDSDNDGQISSKRIDISKINADVLEILSPLLIELEHIGETLDRLEFIDSALALYQTLNVHQRNQILKFSLKIQK
ncbi:UNKNOWN [Stylonychia lemnae]|uniref:EF-hand domain-containing protein n=1 Tax=Stylonychia lemnae TaxID=5949 RepID=A0A078B168_STYLE|nr:UNKNOWN [Stylonychia lemnae]|eukprot:CDW86863.1 UNKNOWN [Stylonychia lemnae]